VRRHVVGIACIGFFAAATAAGADIGLISVDRTSGRPGDRVAARFGGYASEWPHMPVYLVPVAQAPRIRPCVVHGRKAVCAPVVPRPPRGAPYTLIGRIHYAPPARGRLRFRVPNLPAGSYALVVYCAPCYKGPGGSLIDTSPRFRIL
jgi:hypothetical protein